MRILTFTAGLMLALAAVTEISVATQGQTPPAQTPTPAPGAPPAPGGARGRGGPPLLPTPPLTAPPTPDKDGNFVIGSPYSPAPELTVKDGVPKGTVHEFTMD